MNETNLKKKSPKCGSFELIITTRCYFYQFSSFTSDTPFETLRIINFMQDEDTIQTSTSWSILISSVDPPKGLNRVMSQNQFLKAIPISPPNKNPFINIIEVSLFLFSLPYFTFDISTITPYIQKIALKHCYLNKSASESSLSCIFVGSYGHRKCAKSISL